MEARKGDILPDLLRNRWTAEWITHPGIGENEYTVCHFRKSFELDRKPGIFIIHVSADNRYRLFVNNQPVCFGPARGDLKNWFFETVDIADYLEEGKNTIAALVYNFGAYKPVAQISAQTALIVQGNTIEEYAVNTDKSWKVMRNPAYSPVEVKKMHDVRGGFLAGACDSVDGLRYPWEWETKDYEDANWNTAKELYRGEPVDYEAVHHSPWHLKQRTIPFLEEKRTDDFETEYLRASVDDPPSGLELKDLNIPANQKVEILLDSKYLTTGFPEIIVSRGKGTKIKISYAEALFLKGQKDSLGNFIGEAQLKGNRNIVKDKIFVGYHDVFIADGGKHRTFRPLWFRTFRYLLFEIETADEAIVIDDFYHIFTAYPFQEKASFSSGNTLLDDIWDASWRTARLCAWETYMDCPYYEQLQYIGDTRIQALISLYVAGDDRLMKNAIEQFRQSMTEEGLTKSAWPATNASIIPPFSLFWICMVNDFWWHRDDTSFVKKQIPGVLKVLRWYEKQINPETNMLGKMQHWHFVDWPKEWAWDPVKNTGGVPQGVKKGMSSIINMQFVYATQKALELLEAFDYHEEYVNFKAITRRIKESVNRYFWNTEKGMYSDAEESRSFSQHANIMGILTESIPLSDKKEFMNKILTDTSLIQCTFYYRFYLQEALKKTGMADQYISLLKPWKTMLENGLTTFAEKPEPTRSDCHSWSAHPVYEYFSAICGISPSSPGFKTVTINPHFNDLEHIQAVMPHPLGNIEMDLKKINSGKIRGTITLPKGLSGEFLWKGQQMKILGGKLDISF